MKLKRVVVPVDFSQHALGALDYAIELTAGFTPEVIVVFALERLEFADMGAVYGPPVAVQGVVEEQRRAARSELAKLVARFTKRGVRIRAVLQEGSAHRVIVDCAKRLRADLIVMGTHGRTGVSRVLLGSVAETVVRHAHCPVLTMRLGARGARKRRSSKERRTPRRT